MPPAKSSSSHVGGVDDGLVGQQRRRWTMQLRRPPGALERCGRTCPRPALRRSRLKNSSLVPGTSYRALSGLLRLVDAAVDHLHIGEDQLQVDGLNVAASGSMLPSTWMMFVVVKAAHHMDDGVHLADIGEELVAQALALGWRRCTRPAMSTNSMVAGVYLFRLVHLRELVQPLVRHRHHADIRLDGAEGVVGALARPRW